MAAERPIVSTPIADVAEPYGHIVYIADHAGGFIAACERALQAGAWQLEDRVQLMRATLARTSWDQTAAQMGELLEQAAQRRHSAQPMPASRRASVVVGSTIASLAQ
jgi:UDP-galactopyranose mutase